LFATHPLGLTIYPSIINSVNNQLTGSDKVAANDQLTDVQWGFRRAGTIYSPTEIRR